MMGIFTAIDNFISGNKLLSNIVTPLPNLVKSMTPSNNILNKVSSYVSSNPVKSATTIVATGLTASSSVGKSILSNVGTRFAKSSLLTQGGVIAGGIVATNVLTSSSKAREELVNAPSSLANFGSNLGGVIENPSIENAKKLFMENPLISTTAVAVGGLAVGKAVLGIGSTIANTMALNENTKATTDNKSALPSASSSKLPSSNAPDGIFGSDGGKPITPPTETISAGSSTKKRKRYNTKSQTPSINIKIDDRDIYNVSNRNLYKAKKLKSKHGIR